MPAALCISRNHSPPTASPAHEVVLVSPAAAAGPAVAPSAAVAAHVAAKAVVAAAAVAATVVVDGVGRGLARVASVAASTGNGDGSFGISFISFSGISDIRH